MGFDAVQKSIHADADASFASLVRREGAATASYEARESWARNYGGKGVFLNSALRSPEPMKACF
jgi:hypothetical protein